MAKQYWGVNRGQHETDVVTAGADPSKHVEVVVDLSVVNIASGMSREQVLEHIEMIKNNIMKGIWPPA